MQLHLGCGALLSMQQMQQEVAMANPWAAQKAGHGSPSTNG